MKPDRQPRFSRKPGQGRRAAIDPEDRRPPRVEPAIVHEDDDLIVIDKPVGLLSADLTGQGEPNVFDWLKARYRRRRNRGGRVYIIHRLDKDASGLMVFGLSERGFRWLKDDFKSKRVHRLYLGLAEGELGAATAGGSVGAAASRQLPMGSIQTFLGEGADGLMRVVPMGEAAASRRRDEFGRQDEPDADEAKPAVTHYRVLATGRGLSLVQFRLETGRRNQIRVHMRHLGHPLVGDRLYGATQDPIHRLGLHAAELGFRHPATGQSVRFRSETPASFSRAVGKKSAEMDRAASEADEAKPAPAAPAPPVARSTHPVAALPASAPRSEAKHERAAAGGSSWDHVAEWYDRMIDEGLTDHYERVIIPGTLRLLGLTRGQRLLDVACGQGVLCRTLARLGVACVGIDASPKLIDVAARLGHGVPGGVAGDGGGAGTLEYFVGDARDLDAGMRGASEASRAPFDAASCVMALMNIDPIGPVLEGISKRLSPVGAAVIVMLHPAFRAPGQTSWGWDEQASAASPERRDRGARTPRGATGARGPAPVRQFRRVDGYLSPGATPIVMNPGRVSSGGEPVTTWTYHRPLQAYVEAMAAAGLLIERLEEWPSARESQPGPRAAEENRARREIPMFLGIRAVKR